MSFEKTFKTVAHKFTLIAMLIAPILLTGISGRFLLNFLVTVLLFQDFGNSDKTLNNQFLTILPYQEHYDRANLSGGSVEHRFVFFDMAIQHVTRAARVFRQPGKHMQMVGVGGTGKATVAKLAAFIEDCAFLRPYVSRTYSLVEFRDDLKKGCVRAGVKGDNTVLFLTDNLVKVSLNNSPLRHKLNFPHCYSKEGQMGAAGI